MLLLVHAFFVLGQIASPAQNGSEQIRAALDHGQFAEAKKLAVVGLQTHREDPALWFDLGVSCNGLNEVDQAIDAFEKAHAFAPNKPEVDFDLGLLYWQKGEVAKAKEAYKRGLARDSKNDAALQNYALLLIRTGENEEAIGPLLALKKLDTASLPTRVSLIECYVKADKREAAQLETNELLQTNLAGFEERTKLGAVLIEDGALDLAETALQSSLKLNPAQPKAYAALGLVFLNQKRHKDAAESFESAVHLAPDSAEYAMAFANALVLWNRPTTLLAFLNSVQNQFGNLPEFQHKLAFAYYGAGQFSKAIDVLQNLLHSNPERQDQIYFLLANSYFGMGELDDSEAAFRKAIKLNPKDPLYYASYVTLLRKEGQSRVDDALGELKLALQLAPQDPALLLQAGLCHESKGDAKNAVGPLEAAVKGNPESLSARVALARVYFRLGRKDEGAAEKQRITELEAKLQKQQNGVTDASEDGSLAGRNR